MLYDDIYVDSLLNVQPDQEASKLFNFAVLRMRYLFIIPQLVSAVNQYQSPICSAPVTCSPWRISELQIEIGGNPVFQEPLKYGQQLYEFFDWYQGSDRDGNAIKSSDYCGLIKRYAYELCCGVIVIDLKRVTNESLDSVRKSLQLKLFNRNKVPMNYQLIVSSQTEISLDRILCQVEKLFILFRH